VGTTPDIRPGDIVRTRATDSLGVTKIRNGSPVQDQTIVQNLVTTQLPVQTAPGVVQVKGYGRDMLVPGQRLAAGSIQVRLVSKVGVFDANARGNIRADTTGALQGTIAYEGTSDVWVATFPGLSAADVALATDPATSAVARWPASRPPTTSGARSPVPSLRATPATSTLRSPSVRAASPR
jgi:hypothetical protein